MKTYIKAKSIHYYKCRNTECKGTTNSKVLHKHFRNELNEYKVDEEYIPVIKRVMEYSFLDSQEESKHQIQSLRKQLTENQTKLDAIEERFAIGEINLDLYQK